MQTRANLRQIIVSANEAGCLQRQVVQADAAHWLAGRRPIRMPARHWLRGGPELDLHLTGQLQRTAQPLGRLPIWSGGAVLQLLDTVGTEPRSFGQRVLRQAQREAMPSQELAESGVSTA